MAKFIHYRLRSGEMMRAAVRTQHRNGDVTAEPFFYLDKDGNSVGAFQGGFKLRVAKRFITKAAA